MTNEKGWTRREISQELNRYAQDISEQFNCAPVVISVAGSKSSGVRATTTVFVNLGKDREGRMRDKLGILQAATQIEAYEHLVIPRIRQQRADIAKLAEAVKKLADEVGISLDL